MYWDARFLMNWMTSNRRPLEEEEDIYIYTRSGGRSVGMVR
jgi:hypothetical protein